MDTLTRHPLSDGGQATLRLWAPADAEGLRALSLAVLEDGRGVVSSATDVQSAEDWEQQLSKADADQWLGLVALFEDRIIGSAHLNRFSPRLIRHVGMLAVEVHPDFQRMGLGQALMTLLVEQAERIGLTRLELYVRADNDRARVLYRKLGFVEEGLRRRFVRLPDGRYVDDVVMARLLGDAVRAKDPGPAEGDRLDRFRDFVRDFVAERRWEPFHDPKNLAMAVASEAGELCSELRWVPSQEADAWAADQDNRERLSDEIADVGITLLMLADRVGLDLVATMRRKMEKNRRKYPAPGTVDPAGS